VLCTLAALVATAGVVALARGGEAFWICVPAALLLSTWARTLPGVLLTSAAAVGVAAAPALVSGHVRPEPSVALAVLIPAASVAVLQLVRERADREREALRAFALPIRSPGRPTDVRCSRAPAPTRSLIRSARGRRTQRPIQHHDPRRD
jgi:hypothetical protein